MMKIHPTQRSAALAAVGTARRMRRPHVAVRPKAIASSNSARSPGSLIDPETRREPAFDAALQDASGAWPGCTDWEVIGADYLEDGWLMQPQSYGSFETTPRANAYHEAEADEDVGDPPGDGVA